MLEARIIRKPGAITQYFHIDTGPNEVVLPITVAQVSELGFGEFIIIPVADLPPAPVIREKEDGTIFYDYSDHPDRPPFEPPNSPEAIESYVLDDLVMARALRAYEAEKARKAGFAATLETVRKATVPEEMPPTAELVAALRDLGLNIVEG